MRKSTKASQKEAQCGTVSGADQSGKLATRKLFLGTQKGFARRPVSRNLLHCICSRIINRKLEKTQSFLPIKQKKMIVYLSFRAGGKVAGSIRKVDFGHHRVELLFSFSITADYNCSSIRATQSLNCALIPFSSTSRQNTSRFLWI